MCPDGHVRPAWRRSFRWIPAGATAATAPRGMTAATAATPASPGTGVALAGPPADGVGRRAVRRTWPGRRQQADGSPGPRGSRRVLGTTGNGGLAMTTDQTTVLPRIRA